MSIARLHLITPELPDHELIDRVRAALDGGAAWIQVRAKGTGDRPRWQQAVAVRELCRGAGAVCLVNDRVDLALAAGTDGVHVGLEDLPVPVVRALVPPAFVVGATVRNPDQARRAEDAGASYLGVGPVYRTTTKAGLPDPMGPAGLAAVAAAVTIPVIAISGITPERVPEVLDAGAHGVAVVAGVFGAADVREATSAFLAALGDPVPSRTRTDRS